MSAAVSSLRLGVVQPSARSGDPEEAKLEDAVASVAAAGAAGVELLLFPESYPGPILAGSGLDGSAEIAAAAAAAGSAVCWGRVERGEDGLHRTLAYIHGPKGEELLRYERSHPATGDVHPKLSGAPMAPGPRLGLTDVGGVRVGIVICSELWIPEIARSLAVAGAEIVLAPAGGAFRRVAPNWRLIARARAIENQLHVALTQALFGGEEGSALVAGPERLLGSMSGPGLLVADCDLDRARWLRVSDDSMEEPKQFDSLPGLLRARRPDLYDELSRPAGDLYDYDAAARG